MSASMPYNRKLFYLKDGVCMNRIDEIIWKRNKIISIILWVVLIVGFSVALIEPKLFISNGVVILYGIWLAYANAKRSTSI